jgi:hypothetical protein
MQLIERLAARTGYLQNYMKNNIISCDLNLSQVDWNGSADGTRGNQAFINRLVWENGCMLVVGSPT